MAKKEDVENSREPLFLYRMLCFSSPSQDTITEDPSLSLAESMVLEGKALDVIEDMPEKGPSEVLEKYVLVAVLCSHPQLYARPTMDRVVKMLETDLTVPSIPEGPIPLVAEIDDIERYRRLPDLHI